MGFLSIDIPTNPAHWLFIAATLALIYWITREYPAWRAERLLALSQPTTTISTPAALSTTTTTAKEATASTSPAPGALPESSSSDQVWPESFSVRWIPYVPVAVLYLLAKAIFTGLRLLIFYGLFGLEQLGLQTIAKSEDMGQWVINDGPEFIRTKVALPLHTGVITLWHSPAVAQLGLAIRSTFLPAMTRFLQWTQAMLTVAFLKAKQFIGTASKPVVDAATWFAIECIYNPAKGLWTRVAVVGHTFIQTAKIYLNELFKDAVDLWNLTVKAAVWLWDRALCPASIKVADLGTKAGRVVFLTFVPWLFNKTLAHVLIPVATSLTEAYRIVRSHPSLLAGIRALSVKIQEKGKFTLDRLESINWLVLLETVVTKVATKGYHYTVLGLELVWSWVLFIFVDVIPNAYDDLKKALEFARPIVAWLVDQFIKIATPLWRLTVWISAMVTQNARPFLAGLHQKVVLPAIHLWQQFIQPGLSAAVVSVMAYATKIWSFLAVEAGPWFMMIAGPTWRVMAQVTEVLRQLGVVLAARVSAATGELGPKILVQAQALGPWFEVFKAKTAKVTDEMVQITSTMMMDWVKKEKRD